jgi:hypothetical protein
MYYGLLVHYFFRFGVWWRRKIPKKVGSRRGERGCRRLSRIIGRRYRPFPWTLAVLFA